MSFEYLKNIVKKIKDLDVDINDYRSVVKNPYLPSTAYVNWAVHLASLGMAKEAEEKLTSSILMSSQNPEAYLHLGILKTQEKDYKAAIKMFLKAIRRDRDNSRAFCFLGNVLAETGEYKEAEKNYKQALLLEPNNSDILLNWGIALLRQKKYTDSIEKFRKSYKFNMSNLSALYFWGIAETELNDLENAKEKFQALVSIDKTNSEAFYYLAYILYKEKKYIDSLTYSLKSLSLFNKKTETYMLISECYMYLNDETNCFKYYELGEKDANINFFFLISWGLALQRFKKFEESKEKFHKAIEMSPENELGYSSLGVANYETKDYYRAEEAFAKALELNPNNAISLDKLGDINYDREKYTEAIEYYKKVLKLSANFVQNYAKIAKAYFLEGNFESANEYYEKAIEYSPNEMKLLIDYSEALIAQKDYKTALRKIRVACKIDDRNIDCLHVLFYVNYLLAKENIYDYNVKEAIEIAKKIEDNYPDSFKYGKEKEELESLLNSRK